MSRGHSIDTKAIGPHRAATKVAPPTAAVEAQRVEIRNILRGPRVQAKREISEFGDEHEREANRVADEVMRMPDNVSPVQVSSAVVPDVLGTDVDAGSGRGDMDAGLRGEPICGPYAPVEAVDQEVRQWFRSHPSEASSAVAASTIDEATAEVAKLSFLDQLPTAEI